MRIQPLPHQPPASAIAWLATVESGRPIAAGVDVADRFRHFRQLGPVDTVAGGKDPPGWLGFIKVHRHSWEQKNITEKNSISVCVLSAASSLIFFVPTLAFKFLVFPECWIIGRPLTKWRRYWPWRRHAMSCFIRRPFFRFCHGRTWRDY